MGDILSFHKDPATGCFGLQCSKCSYFSDRRYHALMHYRRIHVENGIPQKRKRKFIPASTLQGCGFRVIKKRTFERKIKTNKAIEIQEQDEKVPGKDFSEEQVSKEEEQVSNEQVSKEEEQVANEQVSNEEFFNEDFYSWMGEQDLPEYSEYSPSNFFEDPDQYTEEGSSCVWSTESIGMTNLMDCPDGFVLNNSRGGSIRVRTIVQPAQ